MKMLRIDDKIAKELDELKEFYRVNSYDEVIRMLIKKINGETIEIIV